MSITPRRFMIVAGLFLVWNLLGDAAYLMQVSADLDALAKTDPYTAGIWRAMPVWAWSAYAVAVWGGTLASVLLLLKRSLSVPLFVVSLLAVIAQFGYTFLATDLLAVKGWGTAVFPAVIFAIGVVELAYARATQQRGVLR